MTPILELVKVCDACGRIETNESFNVVTIGKLQSAICPACTVKALTLLMNDVGWMREPYQ